MIVIEIQIVISVTPDQTPFWLLLKFWRIIWLRETDSVAATGAIQVLYQQKIFNSSMYCMLSLMINDAKMKRSIQFSHI